MEDTRPDNGDAPPDQQMEIPQYRPPEPRVPMVLLVQVGLSMLFAIAGAAVFQVVASLAGWDDTILSGTLPADASAAEIWQLRLLLSISQFTTFLLAGWITVRMFYSPLAKSVNYLNAGQLPRLADLLMGMLIMAVSIPLVLYLYQVNKALPLPESMRLMEDQTEEALKALLQMNSPAELLANLVLIALLPALGEELVFRGVVQQQLMRVIRSPWPALLLTAAVFSFVHLQFEGFLPRMLLGLLLGWMYWRTQNFWVPVAAHFFNNGAQVFGQYLYHRDISSVNLEQDIEVPWMGALTSAVLVILLFRRIGAASPNP